MSDEIQELKAYIKAVVNGYVITDNMGHCNKCGEWKDLRMGHCFTCVFEKCPLDSCEYRKMVFNYKRERVLKDLVYSGSDGIRYCNRMEGMCDEAVVVISRE